MNDSEVKMDSSGRDKDMDLLMVRNDLIYEGPRDGSLVAKRTYVDYEFGKTVYVGGSKGVCRLNSGGDSIYGPGSYLKGQIGLIGGSITTDGTERYGPASASFVQTISEIVQKSGGEKLEQVTNADIVNYTRHKLQADPSFDATWGGVVGHGALLEGAASGGAAGSIGPLREFCIPMSMVSDMWAQKEPIPAEMAAGLEVSFTFNTFVKAFKHIVVAAGKTYSNYQITNLKLVCDTLTLRDSANSEIALQSANKLTGGLKFTYSTYEDTPKSVTVNRFNIDLASSASVPIRMLAIPRLTAGVENILVDSYLSSAAGANDLTTWRVKSGSSYMPQDKVESVAESFMITTQAFGKIGINDIGLQEGINCQLAYNTQFLTGSLWAIAVSLYKSPTLPLSSDPVNNNRTVNFSGELTSGSTGVTWDVILQYAVVANVMNSNIVLDI